MGSLVGGCSSSGDLGSYIMLIVVFGLFIALMVLNRRSQQKKQKETMDLLDAVKPGNKVKTIGLISGTVVEVCPEDNTFVMETGSETTGKSYLRLDKQAIYWTDAVVKAEETVAQPETVETVEAETAVEEDFAPVAEETVENAEVTEETTEETVEEVAEETKDVE